MAGTNAARRARAPESGTLPSIRDGIMARWSSAHFVRTRSRLDAAVDVGGNQIVLTGTVPTLADHDRVVSLAAVDSLGMLIDDRIRLPRSAAQVWPAEALSRGSSG